MRPDFQSSFAFSDLFALTIGEELVQGRQRPLLLRLSNSLPQSQQSNLVLIVNMKRTSNFFYSTLNNQPSLSTKRRKVRYYNTRPFIAFYLLYLVTNFHSFLLLVLCISPLTGSSSAKLCRTVLAPEPAMCHLSSIWKSDFSQRPKWRSI